MLNAMELVTIGAMEVQTEELTALGRHLASLPVDPKIGKMRGDGRVFKCLDPILTIATGLAHRDPFVLPMDKKELADKVKSNFAGESFSDHIALLRAFDGYQHARRRGGHSQFAWRNFLSENTLRMWSTCAQFRETSSTLVFRQPR